MSGYLSWDTGIANVYILHGKASLGGVFVHLIVHSTNIPTASLSAFFWPMLKPWSSQSYSLAVGQA